MSAKSLDQEQIMAESMLREYAEWLREPLTVLPTRVPGVSALAQDVNLETLWHAEQYSLNAGGKRIRGALVLETCRMLGGNPHAALPLACAIEMIHAASLIHDDLPCMDNDDLRRGKPTNHKVFGEATALLAGDGLLLDAITLIAQCEELPDVARLAAVSTLSAAAGSAGMVGGQEMDLESEGKTVPKEYLESLHARKTGALFGAALRLGAIAAGKMPEECADVYDALDAYAHGVGLSFQIMDDILDVTADPTLLGKTKGKDAEEGKNSFLRYYTIEQAQQLADSWTDRAVAAVRSLPESERLCALAHYLRRRAY